MLYKAHEKVVHARQRRLQEYAGRLRRVLVSERITLIREFGPPPSPTREPRPQNGHARNRPTQENDQKRRAPALAPMTARPSASSAERSSADRRVTWKTPVHADDGTREGASTTSIAVGSESSSAIGMWSDANRRCAALLAHPWFARPADRHAGCRISSWSRERDAAPARPARASTAEQRLLPREAAVAKVGLKPALTSGATCLGLDDTALQSLRAAISVCLPGSSNFKSTTLRLAIDDAEPTWEVTAAPIVA